MIITDGMHLASDSGIMELHAFACKIGLHRRYFDSNPRHHHYDLLPHKYHASMLEVARVAGAGYVSSKQLVQRMKRR